MPAIIGEYKEKVVYMVGTVEQVLRNLSLAAAHADTRRTVLVHMTEGRA
jgi:hypothetical protein